MCSCTKDYLCGICKWEKGLMSRPKSKLYPIERILFEANQVAEEAFQRPIIVYSKEELMLWLMSRAMNDKLGGL